MSFQNELSLREVEEFLKNWSDDEVDIARGNVNVLPPDDDEQTDEEAIDKDFVVINSMPKNRPKHTHREKDARKKRLTHIQKYVQNTSLV